MGEIVKFVYSPSIIGWMERFLTLQYETLNFNNMKIDSLVGIQLKAQHLSCTFDESCNRFLKTHKGLSYLCMRYPNLSLQDAIKEYKLREAEFYCP